jgi:hypothetical protein
MDDEEMRAAVLSLQRDRTYVHFGVALPKARQRLREVHQLGSVFS